MERALGHRAVAEEGHRDAAVGPQLGRGRRADGDRQAGADDAVGPEDPEGRVGDVHRAAPAAVRAARPWPSARRTSPSGSRPLARQWPWPRWVDVMTSAGPSGQQAPTADASWPIDRWTKPGHLAVAVERGHPLLEAPDHQHPPVHLEEVVVGAP